MTNTSNTNKLHNIPPELRPNIQDHHYPTSSQSHSTRSARQRSRAQPPHDTYDVFRPQRSKKRPFSAEDDDGEAESLERKRRIYLRIIEAQIQAQRASDRLRSGRDVARQLQISTPQSQLRSLIRAGCSAIRDVFWNWKWGRSGERERAEEQREAAVERRKRGGRGRVRTRSVCSESDFAGYVSDNEGGGGGGGVGGNERKRRAVRIPSVEELQRQHIHKRATRLPSYTRKATPANKTANNLPPAKALRSWPRVQSQSADTGSSSVTDTRPPTPHPLFQPSRASITALPQGYNDRDPNVRYKSNLFAPGAGPSNTGMSTTADTLVNRKAPLAFAPQSIITSGDTDVNESRQGKEKVRGGSEESTSSHPDDRDGVEGSRQQKFQRKQDQQELTPRPTNRDGERPLNQVSENSENDGNGSVGRAGLATASTAGGLGGVKLPGTTQSSPELGSGGNGGEGSGDNTSIASSGFTDLASKTKPRPIKLAHDRNISSRPTRDIIPRGPFYCDCGYATYVFAKYQGHLKYMGHVAAMT